jgi:diguanylate cyclase
VASGENLLVAAELAPPKAFDTACRMVVDYLAEVVPLGAWAVTRVAGGRQTVLVSADAGFGLGPGVEGPWSTAMCRTMVAGLTPRVVPDTREVPELASALESAASLGLGIGAYVGTPIVTPSGDLFGTVLGLNEDPMPGEFISHEALLDLLSSLLSSVLEADTAATDSARALEQAVTEAETDPLTGLLNRRGWDRWLAREEDRFRRFGDPACVVMLDLDGLKAVNDLQGHDAGDRYIRRAAAVLRGSVRVGDPVARLGGDEFALVAPVAAEDAGRLVDRLQDTLEHEGVPCSLGVAPFSVTGGFPHACSEADAAMYADKRARQVSRSSLRTGRGTGTGHPSAR